MSVSCALPEIDLGLRQVVLLPGADLDEAPDLLQALLELPHGLLADADELLLPEDAEEGVLEGEDRVVLRRGEVGLACDEIGVGLAPLGVELSEVEEQLAQLEAAGVRLLDPRVADGRAVGRRVPAPADRSQR
jgi:hypothetical protein